MYDIFYVSKTNGNDTDWAIIKSKYPLAQRLTNIKSYEEIRSRSFTNMFWVIWDDVDLTSFNLLDYKATKWDDMYVHVFKNGEHYDGVCLFPKSLTISQREFHHRFFTAKKEIDCLASIPKKYKVYYPITYEDYQQITDEMFWLVWPQVTVIDNTIFDIYFSHHNSYDRRENHVFKNLCNENASYFSGVILCSKYKSLSNREFAKQYAIDKKEHEQIVSKYQYSVYTINSHVEYLKIVNTETQPMFWGIWPEIAVTDNKIFDLYFDPNDGKYDHDRAENHVFKNLFRGEETYSNGITLFSTDKKIGKREFDHRFLIKRKEHDVLSSKFKPYDIIFISYNEPNADENYNRLLQKFPKVKRVDKIKGIHQAHIKAAEIANSEMFWAVDGDAVIVEDFIFDYETSTYERDIVHVWQSKNPVNELIYGYGGVKLLPKNLTLEMNVDTPDMTTAISKKFKAIPVISNITAFDTDPFSTWKSAFRECVKLSSRIIDRQQDEETQYRLDVWCNESTDRYALDGANAGRDYGLANKNNLEALKMINDFTWLEEQFDERCRKD